MRKLRLSSLLLLGLGLFSSQVSAITLALLPSATLISLGDNVTVELQISGLGNYAPPSLGAFEVEIAFDSTVLAFDRVEYGNLLGDPQDGSETDIQTTLMPASIVLDEISLLAESKLDALQPEGFVLTTLTFKGIGIGQSPLLISQYDLSDAPGSPILPPELVIISSSVKVDEPAILVLLISSLSGLIISRRRWFKP